MQSSQRTFIAIEIPADIQNNLKILMKKAQLTGINGFRPVRPEMIHLTLKFLGDSTEFQIVRIQEILSGISRTRLPFEIQVRGLGAFPSWDNPRTIWAGLTYPPVLQELSEKIDESTKTIGFPVEKRCLSPHLTLARIKEGGDRKIIRKTLELLLQYPENCFGIFVVSHLVLFESKLQPGGSIYTPISIHRFSDQDMIKSHKQ
jgi:2'-5' RNA ligase